MDPMYVLVVPWPAFLTQALHVGHRTAESVFDCRSMGGAYAYTKTAIREAGREEAVKWT